MHDDFSWLHYQLQYKGTARGRKEYTLVLAKISRNPQKNGRMFAMQPTGQVVWFVSPTSLRQSFAAFPTPLGWFACRWIDDQLDLLTFGHASQDEACSRAGFTALEPAHDTPTDQQMQLLDRLTQLAEGIEVSFDEVPLNLDGMTAFQKRVIACCRRVRWGHTVSYGELAERAGRAGAARAVGTVMSRNRFPLIVPCHRVIGGQGSLGGYSAPRGLEMKRQLLEMEKLDELPEAVPAKVPEMADSATDGTVRIRPRKPLRKPR